MFSNMATLPKVKWDTPTFSKNTSMVKHTTLPNKEQPQFDKLSSDEPSYETKLADEGVYSPEGYDIMYYQGQPLDPEIYGYAESTTGSVPLENITSNPAIWMFNRKNQMQKWNESGDYPWGKRYKFATGGEVLELTDEEIQQLRAGGHIVVESKKKRKLAKANNGGEKNDRDWFNAHGHNASDDPRYAEDIQRRVYSGNWGYNPYTGTLHKLDTEDKGTATPEEKFYTTYDRDTINAHKRSLEQQARLEWEAEQKKQGNYVSPYDEKTGQYLYENWWEDPNYTPTEEQRKEYIKMGVDKTVNNPVFQTAAMFTPPGMVISALGAGSRIAADASQDELGYHNLLDVAEIALPFAAPKIFGNSAKNWMGYTDDLDNVYIPQKQVQQTKQYTKTNADRTVPTREGLKQTTLEDEFNTLANMNEVSGGRSVVPVQSYGDGVMIMDDLTDAGYQQLDEFIDAGGKVDEYAIRNLREDLTRWHNEGILHGDLKSNNIFYNSKTGELKVIDPAGYPIDFKSTNLKQFNNAAKQDLKAFDDIFDQVPQQKRGGEVMELTNKEIQQLRKGGHIVIEQ
jgi:tRNA A-37 threonylcarbamoyl transferase component Bud32